MPHSACFDAGVFWSYHKMLTGSFCTRKVTFQITKLTWYQQCMQFNWCDSMNNYEQVHWKRQLQKYVAHSDSKKPSAVKCMLIWGILTCEKTVLS